MNEEYPDPGISAFAEGDALAAALTSAGQFRKTPRPGSPVQLGHSRAV